MEGTRKVIELFIITNEEVLTNLYFKSDAFLLACVFEELVKVSINEFNINPLYCVSLAGYTWQCGLEFTDKKLQTLQDREVLLLIKNNIRGEISSVMGDRYVESDESKKILYIDANYLYGHAMSQTLTYDEIKFDGNVKLEGLLKTPDDSDIGYFDDIDLKNPDEIEEKTKCFPFSLIK